MLAMHNIMEIGKPVEITKENFEDIIKQLNDIFDKNQKIVLRKQESEIPFTPRIVKNDDTEYWNDYKGEEYYTSEEYDEEDEYDEENEYDEDEEAEDYGDIYDDEDENEAEFLFMLFDLYDMELSYLICRSDKITLETNGIRIDFANAEQEYLNIKFSEYTDEQFTNHITNALVSNINDSISPADDIYFSYFLAKDEILSQLRNIIHDNVRKRRLVTTINTEYGDFLFKINPVEFLTFGSNTKKLFTLKVENVQFGDSIEITEENYQQVADLLKSKFCEKSEYGILSNMDDDFRPFTPIFEVFHDEEGLDINLLDKYFNMEILLTKGDWVKELKDGGVLIHSDMPEDENGIKYSPEMFLVIPKEFSEEEKYEHWNESLTERVTQILEEEYYTEDVENIVNSLDIVSYLRKENKESQYSVYVELEDGREVLVTVDVNEFRKNGRSADNIVTVQETEICEDDEDEDEDED